MLAGLLNSGSDGAAALTAPGRSILSYSDLRTQIDDTAQVLNSLGIGRNDRVAIVLPNGPEMAAAFVAIACAATTAPLNPAYRLEEFEFYLSDLGARAVVVEAGSDSPVVEAAARLKIAVMELSADPQKPAGQFTLDGPAIGKVTQGGMASDDDVALILHTSGTTSRPKIVPLSHANLVRSADNIVNTLQLKPEDRCLNIMPLFHIHGLVANILASLAAGGSIACTPGFNALKFFSWMQEMRPTWYSAVPTMHQAIVQRAARSMEIIEKNPLRFIRSSSAPMSIPVIEQLEQAFGCPLIEAYAMTEAAHQMTSNPLPPAARKSGTVGPAAGPDVAIMDDQGKLLEAEKIGEVVIRGDNVTSGYENNPEANRENWTDGWFRTGDQGRLDDQGYLTVTGRLKEIINRGGEKISPKEVDDVLIRHPAIAQVVTFAVPHQRLGEEVGAAIVIDESCELDEPEVKNFAAKHLADFKVPKKIIFVEEIPKGATGKLQRIGLAEKLGIEA